MPGKRRDPGYTPYAETSAKFAAGGEFRLHARGQEVSRTRSPAGNATRRSALLYFCGDRKDGVRLHRLRAPVRPRRENHGSSVPWSADGSRMAQVSSCARAASRSANPGTVTIEEWLKNG